MEMMFYGFIWFIAFIVFWWMCDFEFNTEALQISAWLGLVVVGLIFLGSAVIPQSRITTVTDIKYNEIEISDDNEYLFVTNENKDVIQNFEIKFVDKTDKNYGKLIKTVSKSDEEKFPNFMLMSVHLESESYVYYTSLK